MDNKKINIFIILILCIFILLTQGSVINEKLVGTKKQIEPYFNVILNDSIKNQVNINNFLKEPKNAKQKMYSSSENYDDLNIGVGVDGNRSVGIIGIGTKNLNKLKSAINPKLFTEIEKNIKNNPYSVGNASYSRGTSTIEGLKITYSEDLLYYKSDYRLSFEFFLQLQDKRVSYLFVLINIIFIFLVCFVLYIKTKEEKKFIIYIFLGILWTIIALMVNLSWRQSFIRIWANITFPHICILFNLYSNF